MAGGLMADDPYVAAAGILLIAGQLILSYFVAGMSKLVSSTWRSGNALPGVMGTFQYGHPLSSSVAMRSRVASVTICWLVILGETAFAAAFLLPESFLVVALICFTFFTFRTPYSWA